MCVIYIDTETKNVTFLDQCQWIFLNACLHSTSPIFSLIPIVLIRYFPYIVSDNSRPLIRSKVTPVTGNTIVMTYAH